MPRISRGPNAARKQPNPTKARKRPLKRSLDAFSIATKQNPERLKIKPNRLGEAETKDTKSGRAHGEEHDNEDGAHERAKHGNTIKGRFDELDIDEGSDSDGNHWQLGHVGSDNDSDIDSDEAMGENDEERFDGFVFRGSSARSRKTVKDSKSRLHQGDLLPEEETVDLNEHNNGELTDDQDVSEEDDLGENAIDLAAVLDASDDEASLEEQGIKAQVNASHRSQSPEYSEGEGQEGSVLSLTDDDEGDQDENRFAALQDLVTSLNPEMESRSSKRPRIEDALESSAPSEFGITSKQKLSISDLLPTITDPRLKGSLKLLTSSEGSKRSSGRSGIPGKLEVPLAKRQQDRLDRAAAYGKAKETLDRWVDTVKQNRRADHLKFPLQDHDADATKNTSRLNLISTSYPLTDLEKSIRSILEQSGMANNDGKTAEDTMMELEDRELNRLPLEDAQDRRARLRTARELLFREEIRAKRIKKIKSKAYRRVHRRQRERAEQETRNALNAAGLELSEDEQEQVDRRRAEERMGARHRESRWAKSVKLTKRTAWDNDARIGVTEMGQRDDELRRRIAGKTVRSIDDSESDGFSEGASTDDEDGGVEGTGNVKLLNKLKKLNSGAMPEHSQDGLGSRLASMKFMQNADAARRKKNDDLVEQIRQEIEGGESDSEEETLNIVGRRSFKPPSSFVEKQKAEGPEKRMEFEERISENEDLQPLFGQANSAGKPEKSTNRVLSTLEKGRGFKSAMNTGYIEQKAEPDGLDRCTIHLNDSAKPRSVLQASCVSQKKLNVTPKKRKVSPSVVLKDVQGSSAEESASEQTDRPFAIRDLDLIKRAFAGDEVVAEFEREKMETIEDEDDKIIDNALPGWGSWTGVGVSKREEQRNKGRFLTKKPGIKKNERKDAKLDRVVINQKRVKKNGKYLALTLPHPFETREQYERSLRLPVGPEWTTKETFQEAIKPRILRKQGIIGPMKKPLF